MDSEQLFFDLNVTDDERAHTIVFGGVLFFVFMDTILKLTDLRFYQLSYKVEYAC